MQMFEERKKEYRGAKKGSLDWYEIAKKRRNKITNSCRDGYRAHVVQIIEKIEDAAGKNDYGGIHHRNKRAACSRAARLGAQTARIQIGLNGPTATTTIRTSVDNIAWTIPN